MTETKKANKGGNPMYKIQRQQGGVRSVENFKKRAEGILFFASLSRAGFSEENPKNLEIYNIENGETIFIRYPGKESSGFNKWDFRPILKKDNSKLRNLSFGDIWRSLGTLAGEFIEKKRKEDIILLCRIFYKLAFLNCHETTNIDSQKCYVFDKTALDDNEKKLLDEQVCSRTNESNEDIQISLESFLVYNDLLCANEDSKYFQKKNGDKCENEGWNDNLKKDLESTVGALESKLKDSALKIKVPVIEKKVEWEPCVGRINTCLTHINLLISIYDGDDSYDLLNDASVHRGVFPAKNNNDLITFLNKPVS